MYVEDNGNSDLMESAIFDSPGGMGGKSQYGRGNEYTSVTSCTLYFLHGTLQMCWSCISRHTDFLSCLGLVGGKIDKCAVLLAGLKGSTASKLSRKLRDAGVSNERLLFCEF